MLLAGLPVVVNREVVSGVVCRFQFQSTTPGPEVVSEAVTPVNRVFPIGGLGTRTRRGAWVRSLGGPVEVCSGAVSDKTWGRKEIVVCSRVFWAHRCLFPEIRTLASEAF